MCPQRTSSLQILGNKSPADRRPSSTCSFPMLIFSLIFSFKYFPCHRVILQKPDFEQLHGSPLQSNALLLFGHFPFADDIALATPVGASLWESLITSLGSIPRSGITGSEGTGAWKGCWLPPPASACQHTPTTKTPRAGRAGPACCCALHLASSASDKLLAHLPRLRCFSLCGSPWGP